jgi:hypothetical protein
VSAPNSQGQQSHVLTDLHESIPQIDLQRAETIPLFHFKFHTVLVDETNHMAPSEPSHVSNTSKTIITLITSQINLTGSPYHISIDSTNGIKVVTEVFLGYEGTV